MARTDLGAVAYWHFATDAIGGTADAEGRAAMAPPDAIGPISDIGRPSLLLYVVVLCS
jgi:hypothetical protein